MSEPKKNSAPDGYVTISEAIAMAEVSRSTFYEHVKAGKVTIVPIPHRGKFVERAQVEREYDVKSGSDSAGPSGPDQSGQVRMSDAEESELVRLRTENAVLLARLAAAQEAERVAQLDKEKLFASLSDSLKTVQFLEMRSLETTRLLEHHKTVPDAGQDEKKPGWIARLFHR